MNKPTTKHRSTFPATEGFPTSEHRDSTWHVGKTPIYMLLLSNYIVYVTLFTHAFDLRLLSPILEAPVKHVALLFAVICSLSGVAVAIVGHHALKVAGTPPVYRKLLIAGVGVLAAAFLVGVAGVVAAL